MGEVPSRLDAALPLGGKVYGDGYITGDQDNIAVVQMVLELAAQPPPPGSGLYGAGCVKGNAAF